MNTNRSSGFVLDATTDWQTPLVNAAKIARERGISLHTFEKSARWVFDCAGEPLSVAELAGLEDADATERA